MVTVNEHGLDDRLENATEIALFRIIQELITNTIRHANASEANIHLTRHNDYLNIMVEDNGDGFDTNGITLKADGMGIKSIDKRVAFLGGTMNIESERGQGSTVIIEIPL
jgi:signal transduction histidine kinase